MREVPAAGRDHPAPRRQGVADRGRADLRQPCRRPWHQPAGRTVDLAVEARRSRNTCCRARARARSSRRSSRSSGSHETADAQAGGHRARGRAQRSGTDGRGGRARTDRAGVVACARPVHRWTRERRRPALCRSRIPCRCRFDRRRRRTGAPGPHWPLAESAIVHADRDLVVVDKPAGMLSAPTSREPRARSRTSPGRCCVPRPRPGRRVERGAPPRPGHQRPHRAGADPEAKRRLAAQFRAHDIERVYHAIAHGDVAATRVETMLVLDRGDGLRGSFGHFRRPRGSVPADAKRAVHARREDRRARGGDARGVSSRDGPPAPDPHPPVELGHPLVGESVYIRDYAGPRIKSSRLMLHAQALGFVHPRSGERVLFRRDAPEDFQAMIEALRPR